MSHVREIFAGNAEVIGRPEVTRRHDHSLCFRFTLSSAPEPRVHNESIASLFDRRDTLVLANVETKMSYYRAIISESIAARGLLSRDNERNTAKRKFFRRRKKTHIR